VPDPFRVFSLTYGPFLTIVDSPPIVSSSILNLRNLQFRFRIEDLQHRQQAIRGKALDPVAQDLADFRLVGPQDLGHLFEREIMLLLVSHELLADVPPEFLQGSGVWAEHERALNSF